MPDQWDGKSVANQLGMLQAQMINVHDMIKEIRTTLPEILERLTVRETEAASASQFVDRNHARLKMLEGAHEKQKRILWRAGLGIFGVGAAGGATGDIIANVGKALMALLGG